MHIDIDLSGILNSASSTLLMSLRQGDCRAKAVSEFVLNSGESLHWKVQGRHLDAVTGPPGYTYVWQIPANHFPRVDQ